MPPKGKSHVAFPLGRSSSFGQQIEAAMARKGWTRAETARQVTQLLPEGETFNAVNLTHYINGRSQPRAKYREALLTVLDLDPAQMAAADKPVGSDRPMPIVPNLIPEDDPKHSIVQIEDLGEGMVRLQIRAVIPWSAALKILELVKVG